MVRVMRTVWNGKQTIANPDSFTEKIKRVERKERQQLVEAGISRANSSSSLGSLYSKSAKTGLSSRSGDSAGSKGDDSNHDDAEGTTSIGLSSDPLIQGVQKVFTESND